MATSKLPFSPAKVNIYRRIFKQDCKTDPVFTRYNLFDILTDDDEDLSRRCAALLVIYYDLPDPFDGDYEALYSFCEDVAHICAWARRSTRNGNALAAIARIEEIRHEARQTASQWRFEAEEYAREFAPYRHYSMVGY